MSRYIVHRFLASIPVLLVVAVFVFGMLHFSGGDPAAIIAGGGTGSATPEQIAAIRANLGLDRPLYEQLGFWVRDLLTGNLGHSLNSGIPVTTLINDRIVPTLTLVFIVEAIAIPLSLVLGILAAWKAQT